MSQSPLVEQFNGLRGVVATVITTGAVESLFAKCHEDLRSFTERNGIFSVEYKQFHAALVEAGRDSVIDHMLAQNYDYCLQVDADSTFPADTLVKLLDTAYNQVPDADMVGAYCQLKGSLCSTTDTGSGTWEVHWPGEGIIPVIRTGAHCILVKRSAIQKMGRGPWFRTRVAPRALDVLAELDGYARQNFAGQNPFSQSNEWNELLEKASVNAAGGPSSVGEDSGFCDRLTSVGGKIYVNTDIVTGHLFKDVITPAKLKERVDRKSKTFRLACGLLD